MYVHMYVYMYECMYVCMYSMYVYNMYVCTYVCTVCTYMYEHVCMYVCTYVCTYVYMYVHTCMNMYICTMYVRTVCITIRVEPIMLISLPVILFCNSCHPSLSFLLHAAIIPVIFFQINFLMKYTHSNVPYNGKLSQVSRFQTICESFVRKILWPHLTYIIIGSEQSAKVFSTKFSFCTETRKFDLSKIFRFTVFTDIYRTKLLVTVIVNRFSS